MRKLLLPLIILLIIAGYFMMTRENTKVSEPVQPEPQKEQPATELEGAVDQMQEDVKDAAESTGDVIEEGAEAAKEAADDAMDKAKEAAEDAGEAVEDAVDKVRGNVNEAAEELEKKTEDPQS